VAELDDESLQRIARSFYVVRMVRYALLVLVAVGVAVVSAAQGAPAFVWIVLGVLAVVIALTMLALRRHYVSSRRPPSGRSSSRSPTG
jgi:uncharacterized protein (DUF58 family)